MELVALGDGARDEHVEVDAAIGELERLGEHGAELVGHPVQAVDDLLAVRAEAQHLACTLVKIAVGTVAVGRVFHDPHGHGWAGDASHGTNGVVMVAGGKTDLAFFNHDAGFLRSLCPAFIDDGTDHAPLLCAAHAFPINRRTSMQKHPAFKTGDGLSGCSDPYEYRIRLHKARQGDFIGSVDFRIVQKLC